MNLLFQKAVQVVQLLVGEGGELVLTGRLALRSAHLRLGVLLSVGDLSGVG